MDFISYYESPFGKIMMASDGEALIGLWFLHQKYFAACLNSQYQECALPVFDETKKWLDLYFAGTDPGFTPKLKFRTTLFREKICKIMLEIPFGRTVTYKDIADKFAEMENIPFMSAQAVGGAVGHNPISLIVPCHRVVGSDGNLTGYAGGLSVKQRLLKLEVMK